MYLTNIGTCNKVMDATELLRNHLTDKELVMLQENLSDQEIKQEVKRQYADLVSSNKTTSCCSPATACSSPRESMKGNLVKTAGYEDGELHSLPSAAVENSFGCGNPLAFAGVKAGQTVLDIGSGAGIDCFIAADKVGDTGKVFGIDMTAEMIEKARANAIEGKYSQVEFRLGEAEAMPVEDESIDWVISNCVINLSPDKPKVFKEIARVLKPGGQFSISDIVLGDELPEWIANNIYAWTGCVAGAIKETEYLLGLQEAGLNELAVQTRNVYDKSMIKGFVGNYDFPIEAVRVDELLDRIAGNIWSAKIYGKKG